MVELRNNKETVNLTSPYRFETDHTKLTKRNEPNQHGIEAITGLDEALEEKVEVDEVFNVSEESGDIHFQCNGNGKWLYWYSGNYAEQSESEEDASNITFIPVGNGIWNVAIKETPERKLAVNEVSNFCAFYASTTQLLNLYIYTPSVGVVTEISQIPNNGDFSLLAQKNSFFFVISSLPNGRRLAVQKVEASSVEDAMAVIGDDDDYKFTRINAGEPVVTKTSKYLEKEVYCGAGKSSIHFGDGSQSNGEESFAFGEGAKADGNGQVVVGRYNEVDEYKPFIVGGGTASNRRNLFTVDDSGNIDAIGKVRSGSNDLDEVATKLNGIWYGDAEYYAFNQYPVHFDSNGSATITPNFERSGIHELYIKIDNVMKKIASFKVYMNGNRYLISTTTRYDATFTITTQSTTGQIQPNIVITKAGFTGDYYVRVSCSYEVKIPFKYLDISMNPFRPDSVATSSISTQSIYINDELIILGDDGEQYQIRVNEDGNLYAEMY